MSAWLRAELSSRRRLLAALGAGGFAFMVITGLSCRALGRGTLGQMFGNGGLPAAFQALSGSRTGNIFSPHGWMSFGSNHPRFLTVTMAVGLSIGAGSVAGEIESGRGALLSPSSAAPESPSYCSRLQNLPRALLVAAVAFWPRP